MGILIITAAGKASRFHDVGYDQPKYLLPWTNKKSILENIIEELCISNIIEFVLLIVNQRESYFANRIKECMPGKIESNIVYVRDTLGQAHTSLLAVEELIKIGLGDKPILIHNSDTILKNRNIERMLSISQDLSGFVDTFQSSDEKYSHILEDNGLVKKFLEKKVISPIASSGLVSFSSSMMYLDIYNSFQAQFLESKELYLSTLIDYSIQDGANYRINYNESIKDTIVLGTPEEYCMAYTLDSTGLYGT